MCWQLTCGVEVQRGRQLQGCRFNVVPHCGTCCGRAGASSMVHLHQHRHWVCFAFKLSTYQCRVWNTAACMSHKTFQSLPTTLLKVIQWAASAGLDRVYAQQLRLTPHCRLVLWVYITHHARAEVGCLRHVQPHAIWKQQAPQHWRRVWVLGASLTAQHAKEPSGAYLSAPTVQDLSNEMCQSLKRVALAPACVACYHQDRSDSKTHITLMHARRHTFCGL